MATWALGVLSSKYLRSKVQYIAAAKTRVGAFSSTLAKQFAAGSGSMFFLQYSMMFCLSASVAAVVGAVVVSKAAMRNQVVIQFELLVGWLQLVLGSFVPE